MVKTTQNGVPQQGTPRDSQRQSQRLKNCRKGSKRLAKNCQNGSKPATAFLTLKTFVTLKTAQRQLPKGGQNYSKTGSPKGDPLVTPRRGQNGSKTVERGHKWPTTKVTQQLYCNILMYTHCTFSDGNPQRAQTQLRELRYTHLNSKRQHIRIQRAVPRNKTSARSPMTIKRLYKHEYTQESWNTPTRELEYTHRRFPRAPKTPTTTTIGALKEEHLSQLYTTIKL